jgi:protein-disulfide isomerase
MLAVSALFVATSAAPGATRLVGVAGVNKMLQGVPQHGIELGKPNAPVTLVEFVEPQCPGCGLWARDQLPGVIARYVRSGKVRLEYRGLSFISADSTNLLELAQAAGEQNKLWNVVELGYANQGQESSGYIDQAYLAAIAKAVPGLDAKKAFAQVRSSKIKASIAKADALSKQYKINLTPSLAIGRTGSTKKMTVMAKTNGQGLYDSIDAALAGKPIAARKSGFPAWAIALIAMAVAFVISSAIGLISRSRRHPSALHPRA